MSSGTGSGTGIGNGTGSATSGGSIGWMTNMPGAHHTGSNTDNNISAIPEESEMVGFDSNVAAAAAAAAEINWCGVESDMGLIFGNHWVIEANSKFTKKNLLKVDVPDYNVWLGNISKNCVDCLERLMELRPSHRLGGRNIHALREHPWLRDLGLTNWENLKTKAPDCAPHFMPGKSYIQKKYGHAHPLATDPMTQQKLLKQLASKEDKDKDGNTIPSRITAKQENQFVDFHYGAPAFDSFIAVATTGPSHPKGLPFVAGSASASSFAHMPSDGSSHQLQPLALGLDKFGNTGDSLHMALPQQSIGSLIREHNSSNKQPAGQGQGRGQGQGQGHTSGSSINSNNIHNGHGGGSAGNPANSIQLLADNLKKSSIANQTASNFYGGHSRPNTGCASSGGSSTQHNHHGSELEEESAFLAPYHGNGHGGFSSGSGSSGLFKSNGARVNANGVTMLQGPSAGNYLPPSSSAPARKKFGMSVNPSAVTKRR